MRPNISQTVSALWVIILSRLAINKKMLLIAHGPHHTYMSRVALLADLVQIGIMLYKLYKLVARYCSRFSIVNLHNKICSFEGGMCTILSHMYYSHSFIKCVINPQPFTCLFSIVP